jgi:hypothetical protein
MHARHVVSNVYGDPCISAGSKGQVIHWVSKLSRRAQGFREHGELAFMHACLIRHKKKLVDH